MSTAVDMGSAEVGITSFWGKDYFYTGSGATYPLFSCLFWCTKTESVQDYFKKRPEFLENIHGRLRSI